MAIWHHSPTTKANCVSLENYSAWPTFVLMAACLLIVGKLSIFRLLDSTPTGRTHRSEALDGLRVLLAMAVFFSHIALSRSIMETGHAANPTTYYGLLGQVGVAVFFMITGFLFWGKLLGQERVEWRNLYVNRLFRIAPLYWTVIVVCFAVAIFRTKVDLAELKADDLLNALRWISPGMVKNPAPFLGDVISTGIVGATWTLYYEWHFYASRPLLFVFAHTSAHTASVIAMAAIVYNLDPMFPEPYRSFIGLFLAGMLCQLGPALPRHTWRFRGSLQRSAWPDFGRVRLFRLCVLLASGSASGGFSALVASGTTLFGLLKVRAARRLGNASYSIFLLHGMVIMAVYSSDGLTRMAMQTVVGYWSTVLIATVGLVCLSTGSCVCIEKAGIVAGRRLLERLHITPRITRQGVSSDQSLQ